MRTLLTLPRGKLCAFHRKWHDEGMSESLRERGNARSQRPSSPAFKKFIAEGWAPRPGDLPEQLPSAPFAAERRAAIAKQFEGQRLVIPAGGLKVRSNDTDYRFRPHSAFRSEEHTSELQSRGHLVCRLLLEKTKTALTVSLTVRIKSATSLSYQAYIILIFFCVVEICNSY